MAAALPIAAAAVAVGGKLYQGISDKNAAYTASKVDDENARLSLLSGEQDVLQTQKDERNATGDMIAAMGGSGIELGSGSAADVLAESHYQGALEAFNIRARATRQANNYYQEAADKRKAGRNAMIGGMFSAVSTALSAASDMRSTRAAGAATDASRQSVPQMRVKGG